MGILQVDVHNAFNSMQRAAILDFVATTFPTAFPWAAWSLKNDGSLLTGASVLHSTTGVQQGDPLGPFLFSCGLHSVIRELKDVHPNCYGM